VYKLLILWIHRQFSRRVWFTYDKAFRKHTAATQLVDWSAMNAQLFNFHTTGAFLHSYNPACPRICQNHQAQAHLVSFACHGTREDAQPLMSCAGIITIAAHVEAHIIQFLALRGQTMSLRAMASADHGLRQLFLRPAANLGAINCWFKDSFL